MNLKTLRKNKKVVLITGCFDILHQGHLKLFQFAKEHADILVVGLERDETIKRSKGDLRPVNNFEKRIKKLQNLDLVDFVFPIDFIVRFGEENVAEKYIPILKKIKPDCLVTNVKADKYWKSKKAISKKFGISFKGQKDKVLISTTKILNK